jgi:hypothetical protein
MSVLERVMEDATAGDPISGLKWTHATLRRIQTVLQREGYTLSVPTISRLLRQKNYSLRVNRKRVAGKQSPGRDEQFGYITRCRDAYLRRGRPVISVDTKKKELIGTFKQAGCAWRREPVEVNMYDFPSDAEGKAIPYGIYDVGRNRGYVVVGTSHDTAQFAVASIRAWWMAQGRQDYAGQTRVLIEADCGGSNGNRSPVWKAGLQRLANEFGLTITVTHYPTGASKWNPIEHRMFNLISKNWAGHPLVSYEVVLKHIRTTRSSTGFRCRARLDPRFYPTGVTVEAEEIARLRLRPHHRFPHWNYTIAPQRGEVLDEE